MVRAAAALALVALLGGRAGAQQDVTPPELLEFTIAPVVFDAGTAPVTFQWCARAYDDLSGLAVVGVAVVYGGVGNFEPMISSAAVPRPGQLELCGSMELTQFSPYGLYGVRVEVRDMVGNRVYYIDTTLPGNVPAPRELCGIGPCAVVNRPVAGLPDSDTDGTPDDADNCPAVPNLAQADRDLDLHGDACDLCPDYRTGNNNDFDGNGIGDPCECGDQTQDAVVNVLDLVAMNLAIFGAVQVSPLCDANNDTLCNVSDIVAANQKIFGQPAYCSRYPPPGS